MKAFVTDSRDLPVPKDDHVENTSIIVRMETKFYPHLLDKRGVRGDLIRRGGFYNNA